MGRPDVPDVQKTRVVTDISRRLFFFDLFGPSSVHTFIDIIIIITITIIIIVISIINNRPNVQVACSGVW